MNKKFCVLTLTFCLCLIPFVSAEDWMPDPHLEQAVRENIQLPDGIPMLPADMVELRALEAEHDIRSLRGLEYAVNLKFLHIGRTEVSNLTPLTGLENLHTLKLFNNRISDISPLVGLVELRELQLQGNFISDLTPLTNLQSLSVLKLHDNQISDVSPLSGLTGLQELTLAWNAISDLTPLINLTNLVILSIHRNPISPENQFMGIEVPHLKALIEVAICDMPRPSYIGTATQRINNRNYPSVFLTHKRRNFDDAPEPFQQLIQYDFSFMFEPFHPLVSLSTSNSPFGGMVRVMDSGDITQLSQVHRAAIRENPNMIFIVEIAYYRGSGFNFPDDSPYWFRNPDGSIARRLWDVDEFGNKSWESLLNFTHPDVIETIVEHAVAVAKCGLYDGIWLDRWHPDFHGELSHLVTPEAEEQARIEILQGIRANVREDFLIMVNSRQELPQYASYINGVFIEEGSQELTDFEHLIKWYESNLRAPAFTLLWGGIDHKPDSQRKVRVFTTLSLTHSDGYVSMSSGHPDIQTHWYPFWDADLGRPVGGDETKAQLYEDREGLFIREFDNGWAVYNRSRVAQTIRLPVETTGVSSQRTDTAHILPDLDGEIYLKVNVVSDLNGDGVVNILDLVIVAKDLGVENPSNDLNGDGVVNILDLVIVATALGK